MIYTHSRDNKDEGAFFFRSSLPKTYYGDPVISADIMGRRSTLGVTDRGEKRSVYPIAIHFYNHFSNLLLDAFACDPTMARPFVSTIAPLHIFFTSDTIFAKPLPS